MKDYNEIQHNWGNLKPRTFRSYNNTNLTLTESASYQASIIMMNKQLSPEPLLPGIPSAPTGKRFITAAEIDYQKRKRRLASRLPVLKPEDLLGTLDQPYYQILLRDLMASGHSMVADEINNLLRKEERDRKSGKGKDRMPASKLIEQPEVLQKIADTLKLEQTLLAEGKKESAMLICKTLADQFLLQDRNIWLARHFYLAVLNRCRKLCPKTSDRLQAEIHCLLANIAREHNESLESALAIAIDHLAVCRSLSREQNWQFKPNTILIRLKRPLAFYGITTDDVYETVDACTMPLYMIASLLEHELLISLANQIMHSPHHKAPTDDDLKNAHEFADLALHLALEVRQPVALSSALTRFGIVLRHVGAFEDAMGYFHQLQQHATITGDLATEAIAFHNMGLCYIGMLNSVEALECFAKQKELASQLVTKELEGNAMHEVGHLLLQEGHLWEAEECYTIAFEDFYYSHLESLHRADEAQRKAEEAHLHKSIAGAPAHHHHHLHHHERKVSSFVPPQEHVSRMEIAWAMAGVSAGQKLLSRLAGLCRSNKPKDLRSVLKFKSGRKPLINVSRPDYVMDEIDSVNRPWSNLKESRDDQDLSEGSWEEGFMFAQGKTKKAKKKVGFQSVENSPPLPDEMFKSNVHLNATSKDVLKELEEVRTEIALEEAAHDTHSSARKSDIMQREASMRRSMAEAMRQRHSSVSQAHMMDKKMDSPSKNSTNTSGENRGPSP